MQEIEVKILEINTEKIITHLQSFAKKTNDRIMWMQFYRHPVRNDLGIRLRSDSKTILTVKGPVSNGFAKVRQEEEVRVANYTSTNSILHNLEILPDGTPKEKRRISFIYEDSSFEIDIFPDNIVPPILEIEAPDENRILQMLELLEIPKEKACNYDANSLFKHYGLDFLASHNIFSDKEREKFPHQESPWHLFSETFPEKIFKLENRSALITKQNNEWFCVAGDHSVKIESPVAMEKVLTLLDFKKA